MSLKTWKINGKEFTLNLSDADVMERYENAFENMGKAEKAIPKDGKLSDRIRAGCKLFKDLFNALLGEGSADQIFEGVPTSLDDYYDIYMNFLEFAQAQLQEDMKKRNDRIAKYMPNRQARRTKKK